MEMELQPASSALPLPQPTSTEDQEEQGIRDAILDSELNLLYAQTLCNNCGNNRRVTFLCKDCKEVLCENCCFLGKCTLNRLSEIIRSTILNQDAQLTWLSPDTTLNGMTDYILKELLPVLECDFTDEELKTLSKIEPQTQHKNQLTPANTKLFAEVQSMIKEKDKKRTETKEKVTFAKGIRFDKGKKGVDNIFSLILNDMLISIDAVLSDESLSISYKSTLVPKSVSPDSVDLLGDKDGHLQKQSASARVSTLQTPLANIGSAGKVVNLNHMIADSSNPLQVKVSAGYYTFEEKRTDTVTLNLHVNPNPGNMIKTLSTITYKQLEDKSFFGNLFSSSKNNPKYFFLEIKGAMFVLDETFNVIYEKMITQRIDLVEKSNEQMALQTKDNVNLLLPLLEEVKVAKEELAVVKKQNSKLLEVDRSKLLNATGIKATFDPLTIFWLYIIGFLFQYLLTINPTMVNTCIFS